jgi:hypothetical protein
MPEVGVSESLIIAFNERGMASRKEMRIGALSRLSPSRYAMAVVNIGPHARLVSDADEEVFLLYTRLGSLPASDGAGPFRGLGFVDSRQDTLTVRFLLSGADTSSKIGARKGRSKTKGTKAANAADPEVVEIELAQDKTALHSRKGDTGSVVWQAR